MAIYKCSICGHTDDEAVPCPKCTRMLAPAIEDRTPKAVKKVKLVKK